jgi:hypothetical protein
LFLRAVSDFGVMKIQVMGYDLKMDEASSSGKSVNIHPSKKRHMRENLNLDQGGLENFMVAR